MSATPECAGAAAQATAASRFDDGAALDEQSEQGAGDRESATDDHRMLKQNFPHTLALLQAIPLSAVTAELPGVTNGWNNIPGLNGLTPFDGSPVSSVPQLRTYFRSDLIPAIAAQRAHFDSLDSDTSVSWIAPLLLIVGIVVILFAGVMIIRNRRGVSPAEALAGASVVVVVGVVVVALVLAISLIPRVSNGQKLLDGLRPAFTSQRVRGDRAGINMVSAIVNTEDPIMTATGGAAAEVPKLIAFVASKTGLFQTAVLADLQKNFPHTTALLQAIPISSVTAEIPSLVGFLTPAVVTKIPALYPLCSARRRSSRDGMTFRAPLGQPDSTARKCGPSPTFAATSATT